MINLSSINHITPSVWKYFSSKWIKGDVSRRILVLDTSLFIHFDDKYFRTEGVLKNSHLDRHPSSHLNDTWSKSTKPCLIITWDGVVFNGEHHYVDHIYYMIHARPFGLSVPRPYLHMLGSSSLTWVFCVCKNWLAPVVDGRRAYHTRSSRGVWARRTLAMVHTQGEHFLSWNLVRDHLIMLPIIKAR